MSKTTTVLRPTDIFIVNIAGQQITLTAKALGAGRMVVEWTLPTGAVLHREQAMAAVRRGLDEVNGEDGAA